MYDEDTCFLPELWNLRVTPLLEIMHPSFLIGSFVREIAKYIKYKSKYVLLSFKLAHMIIMNLEDQYGVMLSICALLPPVRDGSQRSQMWGTIELMAVVPPSAWQPAAET